MTAIFRFNFPQSERHVPLSSQKEMMRTPKTPTPAGPVTAKTLPFNFRRSRPIQALHFEGTTPKLPFLYQPMARCVVKQCLGVCQI